jgi:hypothetical protein
MDAIQRMRARAAQSGKLQTTPEQQVIPVYDAGQTVYEILPANPAVIYVPVYDPFWIWGPPVYYPYARWYYPPHISHFYFNSGIYLDTYYGSGWYGSVSYAPSYRAWNNWGWRPAWSSRTVVVNNVFIDNHYSNYSRPRNVVATTATWSHDVSHRRGVVYPTSQSYDRYRRDPRDVPRPQTVQGQGRNGPAQVVARNAGTSATSRQFEQSNVRQDSRDGRPDVRQDTRPDTRQSSRPETRPDTRPDTRIDPRQNTRPNTQQTSRPGTPQDTRIAGRDVTPNSQIRDTRGSQDVRNGGGNINQGSGQGSGRTSSNPALTHTTPAQVMLTRPAGPAPGVSSSSGRSQNQPVVRESQPGRSMGTSVSRPQYQTPSRETASVRGPAPSVSQRAPSRQSVSIPQSAPAGRVGPSQQAALSSNAQAAPSRQSAPQYGSAPAARSAPSQQSAPSHGQGNGQANGQGAGRSSNGGSNGGGHSKGGR